MAQHVTCRGIGRMTSSALVNTERRRTRYLSTSLNRRDRQQSKGTAELWNARPPIQVPNLDGPSFFTYNVPKNPPMMTNFPAFTFRPKTQSDKEGGQQKAWGKEWFSHNYVWLQKADFDPRLNWPSPNEYSIRGGIGKENPCYPRSSSHTFGRKKEFSLVRKGICEEPGPSTYDPDASKDRLLQRPRECVLQNGYRKGHYLWPRRETVPGPGSYDPMDKPRKSGPAFSFANSPRRLNYSPRDTL